MHQFAAAAQVVRTISVPVGVGLGLAAVKAFKKNSQGDAEIGRKRIFGGCSLGIATPISYAEAFRKRNNQSAFSRLSQEDPIVDVLCAVGPGARVRNRATRPPD